MRIYGDLNIDVYKSEIDLNKINLFLDNKFVLLNKKEFLKVFKDSEKCSYCEKQFNYKCKQPNFRGLRDIFRHLKHTEKIIRTVICYFPIENKRQKSTNIVQQIPSFNLCKEQMNNFISTINSLYELGCEYGALKLIPPEGKFLNLFFYIFY